MDYLVSIVKFVPILACLILANIKSSSDWSLGFIVGGILAIIQLVFYTIKSKLINRIIIGVDIYLIIAGLAVITHWSFLLARLNSLREAGVIISILLVGVYTTMFSRSGFIGSDKYERPEKIELYSVILLYIASIALGISFVFRNSRILSMVLPMIVLIAADRVLLKKLTIEGSTAIKLLAKSPELLMKFAPIAVCLICVSAMPPSNWLLVFTACGILAIFQLIYFAMEPKPLNRIIIGVDLYLIITGLAAITRWGDMLKILVGLREIGVVLCILLVGIYTTMLTPGGFIGTDNYERPEKTMLHSSVLLFLVLIALAASFAFKGSYRFSIVIPVIILCIANRNLLNNIEKDNHV